MPVKEKNKKPEPRKCVCCKPPVLVSVRGGRMYSCPNPVRCPGNIRTMWQKTEPQAAEEWNALVAGFSEKRKTK